MNTEIPNVFIKLFKSVYYKEKIFSRKKFVVPQPEYFLKNIPTCLILIIPQAFK